MSNTISLYAAESWEKVYRAFEQVNFVAYDYDAVKQSLLDYLRFYYPENFNDYIESSELIAMVELFAYISEQLAYRVDLSAHENFMPTASRKASVLRLARLISYRAARNTPLRGLVKLTSVSISEEVRDSQNNNLANKTITWNDPNNPLWKEQFLAVMNKVLTRPFGQPYKSFQVDDTVFQLYEVNNVTETSVNGFSAFKNGTLPFQVNVNNQTLPFELVPSDLDDMGVFERVPNQNLLFSLLYADDGFGDASDTTGFLMYAKQGQLNKLQYTFDQLLPNRTLDLTLVDVNNTDVWVQRVDDTGTVVEEWEEVDTVNGLNLQFNVNRNRKKYELESLENDRVRLIFGDGDFSDIPTGVFNIWARQSNSGSLTVAKSLVVNRPVTFAYTSKIGQQESVTFTYSLSSGLQNSADAEDIERIRQSAPASYYAQGRMVNGQDYNTFLLRDPSILRLKAVNRIFSGQPKYLTWNDPSGTYQNVKVFGDDLRIYNDPQVNAASSSVSSRSLIDQVLEPLLSNPSYVNLIVYTFAAATAPLSFAVTRPRTKFIEDKNQLILGNPLQEKTQIQAVLDRHWYGEPEAVLLLAPDLTTNPALPTQPYGLVDNDTDRLIYDPNMQLIIRNGVGGYQLVNETPTNTSGIQETATRMKRFGIRFNADRPFSSNYVIQGLAASPTAPAEYWTIQLINIDGTVGTFSVTGSVSGPQPPATLGEFYDNGIISFTIDYLPGPQSPLVLGDAFIVQAAPSFTSLLGQRNLNGWYSVIPEALITNSTYQQAYDPTDPVNSWLFLLDRVDDSLGNFLYWNITSRALDLTVESPTTKFWYDQDSLLVDPDTKRRVRDVVRVLKSNLNAARTLAVGVDQVYDVLSDVKYTDGTVNFNALQVMPTDTTGTFISGDGYPDNPYQFLQFIGPSDYVYFLLNPANGRLTPIEATPYIESLTFVNDQAGNYVRRRGRDNLDFMWQHFTKLDNLIDPSTSNIIDIFVLTRGYYANMLDYIRGVIAIEPAPPTALELRNSYRDLLQNKMISDTVVMHSGNFKLLFGTLAVPELRAKFRIIKQPTAKLTDEQIRVKTVEVINTFFRIENWDFGKTFYATELYAVIHAQLATEIASVVLVPTFATNYFGDLFTIGAGQDEILLSCATVDDVEVVPGYDRLLLKQV